MGCFRIFINDLIIKNYPNNTNKIHSILIFFQYHIQIECTKIWITMSLNRTVQTLTILSAVVVCFGGKDWSLDEHPQKWNDYSKEKIDQMLKRKLNGNLAKNSILFLGDGMGVSTVTVSLVIFNSLNSICWLQRNTIFRLDVFWKANCKEKMEKSMSLSWKA